MTRFAMVLLSAAVLSACQTSGGDRTSAAVPPGSVSGAPAPHLAVAPLRCPAPGTVLTTSTGNTLAFKGADGAVCRLEVNGVAKSTIFGFWSPEHRSAADATTALRQLDLQAGKEAAFQTNGSTEAPGMTWSNTFTVLRTEAVTVPAGRFEAVLIRWNQTNHRLYEHNVDLWYVPAIGYTVKQRVDLLRGTGTTLVNWEATAVTLPKG